MCGVLASSLCTLIKNICILIHEKMINIVGLVVCAQECLMVNNYESHTKVWVANVAWTITCHMNHGWGSSSSYSVIYIKEPNALEKLS